MNVFLASRETRVRECDCDQLLTGTVVACAHFDNEILRLDDYGDEPPYRRFMVYLFEAETIFYAGEQADEAIRAYFSAQKELLGVDEDWQALEAAP